MPTRYVSNHLLHWMIAALCLWAALSVQPSVSHAVNQQHTAQLADRLCQWRWAIARYRADHNGLYPGQRIAGGVVEPTMFIADLLGKTDPARPPYLATIPRHPFIADHRVAHSVKIVTDPREKPRYDGTAGWWLNVATGEFEALAVE